MASRQQQRDTAASGPRPDLSQHLTRQVMQLIASRGLRPGDRLPSMRELADLMGVATPTIREALRRLQATGVVDIRHGSGIYVRRVEQGLIITNPHHRGGLEAETIVHLLDARIAVEPHLAGRAAEIATADDLADLRRLLEQAETLLNGQDSELGPTNMRFHAEIARIAGNPILIEFMESLVEIYSREQLGILAIFNARSRDYRDHVQIYEAIREHDAELATRRMQRHLLGVREVVTQRLITPD